MGKFHIELGGGGGRGWLESRQLWQRNGSNSDISRAG
jgi:hypothetical protein